MNMMKKHEHTWRSISSRRHMEKLYIDYHTRTILKEYGRTYGLYHIRTILKSMEGRMEGHGMVGCTWRLSQVPSVQWYGCPCELYAQQSKCTLYIPYDEGVLVLTYSTCIHTYLHSYIETYMHTVQRNAHIYIYTYIHTYIQSNTYNQTYIHIYIGHTQICAQDIKTVDT